MPSYLPSSPFSSLSFCVAVSAMLKDLSFLLLSPLLGPCALLRPETISLSCWLFPAMGVVFLLRLCSRAPWGLCCFVNIRLHMHFGSQKLVSMQPRTTNVSNSCLFHNDRNSAFFCHFQISPTIILTLIKKSCFRLKIPLLLSVFYIIYFVPQKEVNAST